MMCYALCMQPLSSCVKPGHGLRLFSFLHATWPKVARPAYATFAKSLASWSRIACSFQSVCGIRQIACMLCVQPGQGWHARFVALSPLVGKVPIAVRQRRFCALLAQRESLQGCSHLDLSRPHAWILLRGKGGIGFTAKVHGPY